MFQFLHTLTLLVSFVMNYNDSIVCEVVVHYSFEFPSPYSKCRKDLELTRIKRLSVLVFMFGFTLFVSILKFVGFRKFHF